MSDTGFVADIIFGRWRSQILFAGVELGIFDVLSADRPRSAQEIAHAVHADPAMIYRLLRALGSLGLLSQEQDLFLLNGKGRLLREDAWDSMRHMVLLEEGPQHYAIWRHLTDIIQDGKQNGFTREYGCKAFEYARTHEHYGSIFNRAMSNFSTLQSTLALDALGSFDFTAIETVCDVAGGHGHLLCSLLQVHKHMTGVVLDLPEVVADEGELWATKLGLQARCSYVGGDMFKDVPTADAYLLKMILHDWDDGECIAILRAMRRQARPAGRIFIVEHIVPESGEPHFSKLYDIHMMCWGSGRERTATEYANLLEGAGWTPSTVHYPEGRLMGIVEGVAGH